MTGADELRDLYVEGFAGFLLAGGEGQLRTAYEIGRRAVAQDISVLELAEFHHDALLAELPGAADPEAVGRVVNAGRAFLGNALSAYEMLQRGFRDARDGARAERRRAAMLRGLTDLLLDGALALDPSGSLGEVALLLAEQARELCDADACLVTVAGEGGRDVVAMAHDPEERAWTALLGMPAVRGLAEAAGGRSMRLDAAGLSSHATLQEIAMTSTAARSLSGWLAAPMTSAGGRALGAIQLFAADGRGFGDGHTGLAEHLARLAAVALERREALRGSA